jgi:hypothetical protein
VDICQPVSARLRGHDQIAVWLYEFERHAEVVARQSQSPVFSEHGENVFDITAEINLLLLSARST